MNIDEIDTNIHVKLGDRVYLAEDLFKLFDVRGISYEIIEVTE